MEFGMPTLIEYQRTEQNLALCGALGLRFIELNMNFPAYQLTDAAEIERLALLAEEARVYYTVHLDENLNIADFNPAVSEAWLRTVHRAIEAAKKLLPLKKRFGAAQPLTLNMHLHPGVHITLPNEKVRLYERYFDVYFEAYRRFRTLCEEWIGGADLLMTVENTGGFRDYERQVIAYLLESPCFALTWDIGHSGAAGETDEPFLLAHRQKLRHFHIHDGSTVPPRNHLALGDGELDVTGRLALAEACGARCVLETKTEEALRKSAAWLRERGVMDEA